jgi:hypothetical protein
MEQNIERGKKEELYRSGCESHKFWQGLGWRSMFIPFNPDFQRALIIIPCYSWKNKLSPTFLFGLVTTKGYKLSYEIYGLKRK